MAKLLTAASPPELDKPFEAGRGDLNLVEAT